MTKKVEVFHGNELVAIVTVPRAYEAASVEHSLEYAYRWTNNIDGSWSKGETIELNGAIYENPDYNVNVEVVKPLSVDKDGNEWGHRSSMMGDKFVYDGVPYVCASFGFDMISE